ncbi:response regulator [Paenibacillus pasadenensis]|uniref:Transcriptional regulatory protein KdpE n=1 Tax=Paenibacillus pasadenensis TaxID=217090 RepID=A0A2N5N585_9BACL|nr:MULTISPECIES: response regulator [Paenibacillus]PLT45473.1 sensor histidine kinase [Paenibacillus pasadenensis]QGG55951.1 response regulator [Paenibacillus sp. B01]
MTNKAGGARILLIEDEPQIRKLLRMTLQAHGYEVQESVTGEDGLLQAAAGHPDLVLLDLGLPDGPGLDVLKRLREWSPMPVIVLTAKDGEEDKIEALDSGADDYVTKPFGTGELVARIRVALRHAAGGPAAEPVLRFGRLTVDLAQRIVELSGERVKLTPTEYDLLKALAQHAGKVMTQKQLLRQVWGPGHVESEGHYLRVYVGHLRKKLEDNAADPLYIATEPGIGYRFLTGERES